MDMELKPQESPPDTRPVPVYVLPYADRDDEISLVDLWRMVVARKHLFLLSVVAALVLASVYIFLAEPLYRAEAHLLPPQQKDIQGLMIDYGGEEGVAIKQYTPDIVYKTFLNNLKSKGLRREFFDAHDLADYYLAGKSQADANIDAIFNTKFNDKLRVQTDKQDASFVITSFSDSDPEFAAQRLNQFIAFANERAVQQLFNDVNAAIRAEIERVRYQLASKLKLAAQRRKDEIIRLQEALRVASALGIESADNLPVTADKEQAPLYMRGTKALEAGIAVLESRKSDEPFTSGLRDLQEKRAFLEGLSINRENLSAVTLDAAARAPYRVEKPRKKLIFALAGVLGLSIGIFLVFIVEFRPRERSHPE